MDYAALLTAVASYTKRSDTAALVPTWISLAETKLNRELRHFRGLTRTEITVSSEYQDAPADLMQVRSARLVDSPYWQLRQLSDEQLNVRRASRVSGTVDSLCQRGDELVFSPIPTSSWTVELLYYAAIPPLTSLNTSNWVLANFPDLYLWSVLAESALFYEDGEQLQTYNALFRDALIGANAVSVKAEGGHMLSPSPGSQAF